MVAWQPESSLTPSECDDLRTAHYTRFMHELKIMGELLPGWGDEITFCPAVPEVQQKIEAPVTAIIQRVMDATTAVEIQSPAA